MITEVIWGTVTLQTVLLTCSAAVFLKTSYMEVAINNDMNL